jgi:superoxide dismutase, Cu-Zn family
MKIFSILIFIISILISLMLGSFYYYLFPFHDSTFSASAIVYPIKDNKVTGTVNFVQEQKGIRVTAHLQGLTPGKHGFHIHKFGNCGGDDGSCAGDHFNPTNAPHGAPTDKFVHVGDLGNLVADQNGNAEYNEINYNIALFGPHSILARSVIVHADPGDLHSQPTGNSGKRIGCGVIGINKTPSCQ